MAASLRSKPTVSSTLRTHSAWWLLAMHGDSQREVLTLTHGGSEVLPVFSFREEAEMYLLMERLGSAAGMDARAFRLGWPPGTRLYELHRPEVIDAKDDVASGAGARPACERQTIGVDLELPSWSDALLSAEYEAQEWSVWLAEGLLFYMTEAATRELLRGASVLAAPHSQLGTYLVNRDLLGSPVMWPLLEVLSRRGAPGRFGTNDPEPLFAEHGWEAEVTQPGERDANYGRWPYPVAPRRMLDVPRLFLIRAQRS